MEIQEGKNIEASFFLSEPQYKTMYLHRSENYLFTTCSTKIDSILVLHIEWVVIYIVLYCTRQTTQNNTQRNL